jgi:hypothetical protein
LAILWIFIFQLSSLYGATDEQLFDLAREQLAKREIKTAIDNLRQLYVKDRSNGNINFLMGAAYAELRGNEDQAIYHLKKAAKEVSTKYTVGSFKERNAPIHTYYYLTLALAAKDECSKAAASAARLSEYANQIDKYFIDEVDRHMQKCPYDKISKDFEEWIMNDELPETYNPDMIAEDTLSDIEDRYVLANLDSAKKAQMGIVTRELEYTTNAPLYGVQIGSGTKPTPISNYGKMKNVDVFVDKQGIIRYVVGHFAYWNQAESLLKRLQAEGYEDAFIVDVNDERKYSNELISYNNVNLRAGLDGEVQYFIQLGAFQDTVPTDLMNLYLDIDGVNELEYKKMTLMTVGPFSTYQSAVEKKDEIFKIDPIELREAFIVAFNRGKKISLEQAKMYTD